MSAGALTALTIAGIAFVGTVVAAPLVNARLQRRNTRRAAHEPAVAAARLILREIETGLATAQRAAEAGVTSCPLPHAAWDQHQAAVAARLSQEELLVLDTYYKGLRSGVAPLVLLTYPTVSSAIKWLADGDENAVKPRKTERSLAPANMDLACRCGHSFGHHGWRAVRRRVRLRRREAKYRDVGFECNACDCRRFRGVDRLKYR